MPGREVHHNVVHDVSYLREDDVLAAGGYQLCPMVA
jgi:hypothetical protein